jgi:hypothetical protein
MMKTSQMFRISIKGAMEEFSCKEDLFTITFQPFNRSSQTLQGLPIDAVRPVKDEENPKKVTNFN